MSIQSLFYVVIINFTRSFNSYSSIEINCEEFDANPKPTYTLIWTLNGENQIL
jgi:hypothetical protein